MRRSIAAAVLVAVIGTVSARATDVGMPVYRGDIQKNATLEIYYEKFNRDIEQDFAGETETGEQEENRFIARATYHASDRASLYGELGVTDSDESEGPVPIVGAGLKVELYNAEAIQLGAFASAQYVHDIEYEADLGIADFKQTENYFEVNGGIIISRFTKLDETTGFVPYGGFMVSMLDGDEDYELVYADGSSERESGDLQDDGMFSIFAGAALTMNDRVGVRLEGRFINQTSFTAGFTYSF
jgi:hypothetical protein